MSEPLAFDIANRLSDQPSLVHPLAVDRMCTALRTLATCNPKVEIDRATEMRAEIVTNYGFERSTSDKPFAFAGGVGIIPIHGLLVNRLSWGWSFITGYNFIRQQIEAVKVDEDVEIAVLDVNSPGGTVAGCQETGEAIRQLAAVKPVIAVVDSTCYSAAYWLASQATKVIITPSGGAGSIGAYRMHVNMGALLKKEGVDVRFIFSGKYKVEGNPYEALSDETKAKWQAAVDKTRQLFAETVARGRGIEVEAVLATEADCFDADDALALGLADAIASPSEALTVYQDQLREDAPEDESMELRQPQQQETGMSVQTNPQTPSQPQAPAQTAAQPQAPTLTSADVAAQVAAGIAADRQRAAAIRNSEEAKDKPTLASHLADSGMDVETAKGILKAAAPEKAETAQNGTGTQPADTGAQSVRADTSAKDVFGKHMVETGNPDLNAGNGGDGGGGTPNRALAAKAALGWGGNKGGSARKPH